MCHLNWKLMSSDHTLKKPTLGPEVLAIYRPISNLPFLSKVLEKIVAAQLQIHLKKKICLRNSSLVSALATALKLLWWGSQTICWWQQMLALHLFSSYWIWLQHSALWISAFFCIVYVTPSVSDSVYNWFSSYFTGRMEYVALGEAKSVTHNVNCGVPQGSVIGPILFILLYTPSRLCHQPAWNIISLLCWRHSTLPKDQLIHFCCPVIFHHDYLSGGGRCLDESKCSAVEWLKDWSHSSRHPSPDPDSCNLQYNFSWQHIPLSTSVINLGVKIDSHLTFETHVKQLCKTSFFHLRNIARLRPSLL